MALEDEVQNVVDGERLKQLTRDDGSTTDSVDTTKLALVAGHSEKIFELWARTTWDVTNNLHLAWGVDMCLLKLKIYKGHLSGDQALAEEQRLREMAEEIGRRNKALPYTNAETTVNTDRARNVNRRHRTRPEFWDGYRGSSRGVTDTDADCG